MSDPVRLELTDVAAVVTLDAPPLNIFNLEMRDGLIEALTAIGELPDIPAMILRSSGRHFSAGADLSEFGSAESNHEARRIRWDRDPWALLWELAIPTIASVDGVAVGSGLEMALLCDIRIAGPGVKLGLPETKLAMLPAAGGTQSLTRAVGPHQAVPVVALADTMEGDEALHRGLVSELAENPHDRAMEIASTLASYDQGAVRAIKRAMHAAGDHPLPAGLAIEHRLSLAAAVRPEPPTS